MSEFIPPKSAQELLNKNQSFLLPTRPIYITLNGHKKMSKTALEPDTVQTEQFLGSFHAF